MDRASASGAEGGRFEPGIADHRVDRVVVGRTVGDVLVHSVGQGEACEAGGNVALAHGELRARLLHADGAPEFGRREGRVLAREEADDTHRLVQVRRRIRAWSPKYSEKPIAEHWSSVVESNETRSPE